MSTELRRFNEAYATMTLAVYEPLILRWVSGWNLYTCATTLAGRMQKARHVSLDQAFATAQALNIGRVSPKLPADLNDVQTGGRPPVAAAVDVAGRPLNPEQVRRADVPGYPDAVVIGDKVYPRGVLDVPSIGRTVTGAAAAASAMGNPAARIRSVPTVLSGVVGIGEAEFDLSAARREVFAKVMTAARNAVAALGSSLVDHLREAVKDVGGINVFEFWPTVKIEEALSPIGVAHYYRQLYFNTFEGVGPIEEAFTIAPLETLEVVYQATRRQIHEEIVEEGLETVSESAEEVKNLDEVSDKVSNMVQRDSSAAMSTSGSGSVGVWSMSGSASANMAVSTQRGREEASRRVKEVTRRASERITKSFTIKTRDFEEVTTTSLTRRVIRNDSPQPVSYGLRRVLRRVNVKMQSLGPRLVWQLYLRDPGAGLARSRFVHFREAEPVSVPEVPPGLDPRPKGGTDTGTTSSDLAWDGTRHTYYVTIVVQAGSDRRVTAVSIDSISDLEGGGKDDLAPSPKNELHWGDYFDEATGTYTVNIGVLQGDAASVSVSYTFTWEPSQQVLDAWEQKRQQAVATLTQELLNEQFEREKTLITERSKIKARPANDLRREERYEVMNRMVTHLFARGDDPAGPVPLEIEYFHRYFDIDGMFVYLHPSWWQPRYSPVSTGFERQAYEITAESDPAPLGSSLGWVLQLDGDDRRNEFLNSPWIRVCLPIRPSQERDAIAWLARHIEGEVGYDPTVSPLKDLLESIDTVRAAEAALGVDGPEYVTVDSTPGAPTDPLRPEAVYPVIDQFDVTVPTDGFVYDELTVIIP
jgi:hypothetical protein